MKKTTGAGLLLASLLFSSSNYSQNLSHTSFTRSSSPHLTPLTEAGQQLQTSSRANEPGHPVREYNTGFTSGTTTASVLEFNGINNIVTIPDLNNSLDLDDFTIEAWIYRTETGSNNMLVSKSIGGENQVVNSNFWLWVRDDDKAEIGWELPNSSNYAAAGKTVIEAQRWYHIAGVRNAAENTLSIYVNGQLDGLPFRTVGKPNNQNMSVIFGDTPGSSRQFHKGYIDEVRIWNRPLSPVEIKRAALSHDMPVDASMVGNWRFNEATGQSVRDESIYANNGFLGTTPEPDFADPRWLEVDIDFEQDSLLFNNFPKQFIGSTQICYNLKQNGHVKLEVFDAAGQTISVPVNKFQSADYYEFSWGAGMPGGIYFYNIEIKPEDGGEVYSASRKMTLLK